MIQKLSPRLQTCADLVSQGGTACDVGTDHAYLAVWLIQNGRCTRVTASDIGEGPLRSAAQTVAQAGLSDQITLQLTDGLNGLAPSDFSDIIIAGMGGETIAAILGAADFSQRDTRLILQPMTRGTYLRCWLAEHGFAGRYLRVSADHFVKHASIPSILDQLEMSEQAVCRYIYEYGNKN